MPLKDLLRIINDKRILLGLQPITDDIFVEDISVLQLSVKIMIIDNCAYLV